MDTVIKINNQTIGRDKIIRLLQYGSRACWYYAQNGHSSTHSIDVLKSLEYTFSSFRKLLRMGTFLDSLYSALKIMKYPDLIVRVTLTMSKISNALFLLADHIIWIGRAGVFQVNIEKWSNVANRYWLMTIIMNLVRDVYEIVQIIERKSMSSRNRTSLTLQNNILQQCYYILRVEDHKDVLVDFVKNGCDLFIPLTALGYTRLSPGVIGLLGFISSAVGLYSLVYPMTKLSPS
ncbi:peroxisomal membrane protein 11B isoform X2 [Cephus cinctus]|uniref:Peroxisomal membrane protein 11B isoform X2 n=1 Tax=Cephus cinctus TaxID=211228 RepID=A0AAJ7C9T8_CEPCN|nr:peroxisomal membrane protein 11B isoform X2 [Cephus cinctus]